ISQGDDQRFLEDALAEAARLIGSTWFLEEGTQLLDRYSIRSVLGEGGMGVVYEAQDGRLRRRVALKLLPKEYAQDSQRLDRFQREARSLSAMNHPHICTIHDVGEYEGQPFIVMELVEGRTLRQAAGAALPLGEVARLMKQTAGALRAAHARGIVHRDIKPE